jgi:hypothetical protein
METTTTSPDVPSDSINIKEMESTTFAVPVAVE